MKRILFTFAALILFTNTYAQENFKTIKGKVLYLDAPVVNADIKVSGSDEIFKSNIDGVYKVEARQGDVITFSYPSLRDMQVVVEDVTRILNITMQPEINELDEVVVKASKRRSQKDLEFEYPANESIINTAWGYLDTKRAPGQVWLMGEEDISPVRLCILDLLQGRFPGVQVNGDCINGGSVTSRRFSSLTQGRSFVFDVDGQLFGDAPIWLPLPAMKRIAIFPGLAMSAQYGSFGAGGVIVINTINGNPQINKLVDMARLRNNIYKDDALSKTDLLKDESTYLADYKRAATTEIAKDTYKLNREKYSNSPYFLIDSYAYFMGIGEEEFASDILEKNLLLVDKNAVYLKALAYYAEANGDAKLAKKLYEQIFILRPNYTQSYRDLAEGYRNVKKYKKAASMYARYNYLVKEGFLESDSLGLGSIIDRDAENLLALEGDQVMESASPQTRLAKYTEFDGTRMLFEWNDSEAEFELQFVNPENHYYVWKHTSIANADRIMDEKLKGYSSEEFLIDGSLAGKWQVNVNYRGNKKLEPTYLKVTSYFNYGLNSQRKEVKVYRLSLKDTNYELFDLVNSARISTN
ncbi:DUF2135 domain-containing protein [Maribacter sp. 2308TA10-17]|uniref:DUF2135 domain-containing protein n=1 Tax=Maribacter sp. 2308TA10-17 TaxID=3386276 RepID=UPI0039BC9140